MGWSCWWRRQNADSLLAMFSNTLGWATQPLLSWRPAPGSARTTRLGSSRCLQSLPQQWTGWCSSTWASTWGCGNRRATSPASLHQVSLASCNGANLSTTPSHSNWTESALPAPRSYPSRTWLARYPLLLRLADSSCRWCWYPPPLHQPALVPKGPQESIWHPTIPQAAAAILQHAKLNYGCVILSTTLYICEKAKEHLFLGSTFMIMIWGATVPLRMKIIYFNFFKNISKGRGWVLCLLSKTILQLIWSLDQKSPGRNVRRKSNCTVQNGIFAIKRSDMYWTSDQIKKELRKNICGDFDNYP